MNNFFIDSFFFKNFKFKNFKNNKIRLNFTSLNRFIICYANNLMIKITNQNEINYTLKSLINKLSKAGLKINNKKI